MPLAAKTLDRSATGTRCYGRTRSCSALGQRRRSCSCGPPGQLIHDRPRRSIDTYMTRLPLMLLPVRLLNLS